MRKKTCIYALSALLFATLPVVAKAATFDFELSGGGISGNVVLTYGSATDAKYSNAYEVTGISGTFSDANIGISNAMITGLVPINHAAPESTNLLAPNDFSKFAVAGSLHGSLSYDNLLWPDGSPQTASSYPFHGGFLDIYGLLFDINNGDVVDIWSNGVTPGLTGPDYGTAVATSAGMLNYVGNGVTASTPEPGTLCLLGTGLVGVLMRRRMPL